MKLLCGNGDRLVRFFFTSDRNLTWTILGKKGEFIDSPNWKVQGFIASDIAVPSYFNDVVGPLYLFSISWLYFLFCWLNFCQERWSQVYLDHNSPYNSTLLHSTVFVSVSVLLKKEKRGWLQVLFPGISVPTTESWGTEDSDWQVWVLYLSWDERSEIWWLAAPIGITWNGGSGAHERKKCEAEINLMWA